MLLLKLGKRFVHSEKSIGCFIAGRAIDFKVHSLQITAMFWAIPRPSPIDQDSSHRFGGRRKKNVRGNPIAARTPDRQAARTPHAPVPSPAKSVPASRLPSSSRPTCVALHTPTAITAPLPKGTRSEQHPPRSRPPSPPPRPPRQIAAPHDGHPGRLPAADGSPESMRERMVVTSLRMSHSDCMFGFWLG